MCSQLAAIFGALLTIFLDDVLGGSRTITLGLSDATVHSLLYAYTFLAFLKVVTYFSIRSVLRHKRTELLARCAPLTTVDRAFTQFRVAEPEHGEACSTTHLLLERPGDFQVADRYWRDHALLFATCAYFHGATCFYYATTVRLRAQEYLAE